MHVEHQPQINDEQLLDRWKGRIYKVARAIARGYKLAGEDVEDIVSACQLRLIRIPLDVRHSSNYVLRTIDNTARSALSKLRASGGTGTDAASCSTLDYLTAAPIGRDEDNVEDALDLMRGTSSPEDELCLSLTIQAAMENLSSFQRGVLDLYYGSGMSVSEIAPSRECGVRCD